MLRRDGILFRRGVLPALVLSVLLAAVIAAAYLSVRESASEGAARTQAALVDLEDSFYSRIAIGTVKAQSYIDSLLAITPADSEEEALELLNQGEVAAVIILPEGFLGNISVGNKAQGKIILSEEAAASADVVAQVALFGERLLAAGQYGVFAGQDLIWSHNLSGEFEQSFLVKSNTGLLSAALSLYDDAVAVEVTPYDGTSLSLNAYYAVSWLVLFLLLSGLFFMELCLKDDRSDMLTRLYALGVTPGSFFLGKWLWPFAFRLIFGAGLLFALTRIMPLTLTPGAILFAILGTCFVSLAVSAVCVITASRSASFGIVTAVSVTGLFLAGGIVPRSMLGRAMTTAGRFTPSGLAAAFFTPLFGGKPDWLCLVLAAILSAFLYFGTLRVLSRRPVEQGGDNV